MILHVRCGDDLRNGLATFAGEYLRWCDPVSDGPCPALEGEPWYRVRADWIARRYGWAHADALAELVGQDEVLRAAGRYDELVLWFEHDLFDQTILVRLLTLIDHPHVTLVQAEDYLGVMKPQALRERFAERRAVTDQQRALARQAWQAWRNPDPGALLGITATSQAALPFLGEALLRHFQEFPDADGLSRTERAALNAIAEGIELADQIFAVVQQHEDAFWLGDAMFRPVLDDLRPLVKREGERWSITAAGRAVLSGERDALTIRPIDRWRGGVHLTNDHLWRWDNTTRTLIRQV